MKSSFKSRAALAALLCLGVGAGSGLVGQPSGLRAAEADAREPLFKDPVLVRGRGVEVRQSQLDEMFHAFKMTQNAAGRQVPPAMRPKIESDIIDKLVATQLCLQKATPQDRDEAKKFSDNFLAEQMKQVASEEAFNRQLRVAGMSPEQYRAQIAEQAVVKTVLDREIKTGKKVSDAEVKSYFDANQALFMDPEKVRVSHVLISTQDVTGRELTADQALEKKKLAEQIRARAEKGEDFAKLVQEFSDDANGRQKGGEYTFSRAMDTPGRAMVPEFEAACFSLKPNQVSDVVRTRYGFHVIKLLEKIPAKPLEFASVSERIRESLLQEQVQKDLPVYLEKLRKEAGVESLDPNASK